MAKIFAPNNQYTGISASVRFVNGVGETSDPHLIKWFQERGYKVVEDAQEEEQSVNQFEQEVEKEEAVNQSEQEVEEEEEFQQEDDQGEQPPKKGGRKGGKRGKARKTEADTRDSGE